VALDAVDYWSPAAEGSGGSSAAGVTA